MSNESKKWEEMVDLNLAILEARLKANPHMSEEIKKAYVPHVMEGMTAIFKQNLKTKESGNE